MYLTQARYEELINKMMDSYMYMHGIDETIRWLVELGFREVELIDVFKFEQEDFDRVTGKRGSYELRIEIHCGSQVQTRKLHPETTVQRGKEIIEELFEEDWMGCDLFLLLKDEVVIYEKERPLCD